MLYQEHLTKDLVGQWMMTEGKGVDIFDFSGKGAQGKLGASTSWTCTAPAPEPVENTTTTTYRDDDECLQMRPNWGKKKTCAGSKRYCDKKNKKAEDM